MPSKKKHVLYLDDFVEELFHVLELQSDEGMSHTCTIIAENQNEAAKILCRRLEFHIANSFTVRKDDD
jgi:hypothetical protein